MTKEETILDCCWEAVGAAAGKRPATGCLLLYKTAFDVVVVSLDFFSFLTCLGPLFCRRFSRYLRWLTFFVLVDLPNAS